MNEIGRYPLLTAAEEVALAKRVERGDRAAKELDDQLESPAGRPRRQAVSRTRRSVRRP